MTRLKTKYKYIEFETTMFDGIWNCKNRKHGTLLCTVEFDGEWNMYVSVNPEGPVKFSADCHRDIAHFLEQLNMEHKQGCHDSNS